MTPRKEKALHALLVKPTKAQAAQEAGIAESTLRTYLQDPEFVSAYRRATSELLEDAARAAGRTAAPALSVLEEIMLNSDEAATARTQAARSSLEFALKLHDAVDVERRLDELEKLIEEAEKQR